MRSKEILTPLNDTLMPTPWNVRYTTFRLGPIYISFVLKDTTKLPPDIKELFGEIVDHKTDEPFEHKKYMCFCIVNESQAYILGQFEDQRESWLFISDYIQRLKFGEEVEIKDQASLFGNLKLSYMGINWIWV